MTSPPAAYSRSGLQIEEQRGMVARCRGVRPAPAPVVANVPQPLAQLGVDEGLVDAEPVAQGRRVPRVDARGPAEQAEAIQPAETLERLHPGRLARTEDRRLLIDPRQSRVR